MSDHLPVGEARNAKLRVTLCLGSDSPLDETRRPRPPTLQTLKDLPTLMGCLLQCSHLKSLEAESPGAKWISWVHIKCPPSPEGVCGAILTPHRSPLTYMAPHLCSGSSVYSLADCQPRRSAPHQPSRQLSGLGYPGGRHSEATGNAREGKEEPGQSPRTRTHLEFKAMA